MDEMGKMDEKEIKELANKMGEKKIKEWGKELEKERILLEKMKDSKITEEERFEFNKEYFRIHNKTTKKFGIPEHPLSSVVDVTRSVYERFNIPEEDSLKNYQVFRRYLELCSQGVLEKESTQIEAIKTVLEGLPKAKHYKITDNITFLLSNTTNQVRKVRFPFIECMFDVKLIVFDRAYYGILFFDQLSFVELFKKQNLNWHQEQKLHNVDLDKDFNDVRIITFYVDKYGILSHNNILLYEKDKDKYNNKIREFTMNLVDFINSEEIKLMFVKKTKKTNERRIEIGRMALPSYNKIYITGYLKKYVDKLKIQKQGESFSHRFWVRGHFRHFWHKQYDRLYNLFKEGKLKKRGDREYIMDDE